MSLPDRILRALAPGLPVDPVLWAQACLEARLFAAFVEALPAAWARGRDGGEV